MAWRKDDIILENGQSAKAQFPIIVSASRSTDIPAFYADWFFHRLKVGYSAWTNPFNGVKSYISYQDTRFIVFWSKNPKPLLSHLGFLKERGIGCYIQYTLNDYENEELEKNVPSLVERIDTFKRLVDTLGFGGVVWRFDPLIITDDINIDKLLNKIENIGNKLKGYTEKLVFSFVDIRLYRKVKSNLDKNGISYHEWEREQMYDFASRLVDMNKSNCWNYKLATCGEAADLPYIEHNRCIDDALIIRRAHQDNVLMDFLKAKFFPMPQPDIFGNTESLPEGAIVLGNGQYVTRGQNRDKGQREFCGCMQSKDIGQYNTCAHCCEYCYANTSKETAFSNYSRAKAKGLRSETITGE